MFLKLSDRLVNVNHIKQIKRISDSDCKIELSCDSSFNIAINIDDLESALSLYSVTSELNSMQNELSMQLNQVKAQLIDISSAIREGNIVEPI